MDKKIEKKGQKKFRHLKDQNPLFFLETFNYKMKTHYIISSHSVLYLGYMEKCIFNQITTYAINSEVTSYLLFQDTLYLGLANGSIVYVSLEHAYNQIPYNKIESIDGKPILGITIEQNADSKQLKIYTVSANGSFKLYGQVQNKFRIQANIQIQRKIIKVVSKAVSNHNSPTLMVWIKDYIGYPIILTCGELKSIVEKQINFQDVLSQREKAYFEDEKICVGLTTLDFSPQKMIAVLGYSDGTVEILKIVKADQKQFFIVVPELKIIQKDGLVDISLNEDMDSSQLSFVTEAQFTGLDYEKRSNPFKKIKVQKGEKGKEISVCRWTRDKNFVVGSVSTQQRKRFPKIFCIEQDITSQQ